MWRRSLLSISILVLFTIVAAAGQQSRRPNGAILSHNACLLGPYGEQSAFTRQFYSREEYDFVRKSAATNCLRIMYSSDGLSVVGYIVTPQRRVGKRYPIVIYNRGGFLERGKIDSWNIVDFEHFSAKGFIVLASQYRGDDGGEGHEELGGADVDDVTNLLYLARTFPYADTKNVFMYGLSRGGMMTFLAMKNGLALNAVAVVGAVYDLEAFRDRAPVLVSEATKLIPNFDVTQSSALRERSVMDWPEKVDTPLLMLHGGSDDEVPATEALAFATKLSNLKKPYELIVYANDIHEVANNRHDRDARIIAWFRAHIK